MRPRPPSPPHHLAPLAAAIVALLAPRAATGDPVDGYLGLLMAGGRPAGLAGAYVGLGEGIGGEPFNPASVGQRDGRLARGWDWDGTVTWYLPSPSELNHIDVNNDGWTDGGLSGFGNLMGGLSGQRGRLGGGLVARSMVFSQETAASATQRVGLGTVTLSMAWSGWRDSLVVGGGLASQVGSYEWLPPGGTQPLQRAEYRATTWRLGGLYRPRGQPWRLGAAFQSGKTTGISALSGERPAGAPTAFDFPWQLSLGGAAWFGPNARRSNEPPPVALSEHPDWGEGTAWEPSDRSPVVVSVQLDLVGPSPGAVSLTGALTGSATPAGRNVSLVPRAGAEWDWIPERSRVRGGLYLEPSRTGADPRPHATLGLEVRVPFWPWDLQLAGGADLANRFRNFSISVGFWSSYAPAPPAAAVEAAGAPGA